MKHMTHKPEGVAALTQERRLTSSMGRANAPVFPEPVCANPMMSLSAAGKKQQRLSRMFPSTEVVLFTCFPTLGPIAEGAKDCCKCSTCRCKVYLATSEV